jgi:hypothetical protein
MWRASSSGGVKCRELQRKSIILVRVSTFTGLNSTKKDILNILLAVQCHEVQVAYFCMISHCWLLFPWWLFCPSPWEVPFEWHLAEKVGNLSFYFSPRHVMDHHSHHRNGCQLSLLHHDAFQSSM